MPSSQSAYRKFHSTETAVTKIYNDLLLAADRGQLSALSLGLLNLTAAFDTVDHELLLLPRGFGDNVLYKSTFYLLTYSQH